MGLRISLNLPLILLLMDIATRGKVSENSHAMWYWAIVTYTMFHFRKEMLHFITKYTGIKNTFGIGVWNIDALPKNTAVPFNSVTNKNTENYFKVPYEYKWYIEALSSSAKNDFRTKFCWQINSL